MLQHILKKIGIFLCLLLTTNVQAQTNNEDAERVSDSKKTESLQHEKEKSATKTIQQANINLSTTITGNQEQPKVLYILPWQSPQTDNVDFESLENQQKSVFGHVEREELRRELEASEGEQY